MKRLVTLADKGMMMGLGKRGMIGEKGMMMGLGKRGVIGDRGIYFFFNFIESISSSFSEALLQCDCLLITFIDQAY